MIRFPILALLTLFIGLTHLMVGAAPALAQNKKRPEVECAIRFVDEATPFAPLASSGPYTDDELLSEAIQLQSGKTLARMQPEVLAALRNRAKVEKNEELLKPEVQSNLFAKLRRSMGDEDFENAVGMHIASARKALLSMGAGDRIEKSNDGRDLLRGWGWNLLPKDDPAYRDPTYLARLTKESGAGGHGLDFKALPHTTPPENVFQEAWRKIAPANVEVESFALTGTDANNQLYSIARAILRQSHPGKVKPSQPIEILGFGGQYAGTDGEMRKLSHRVSSHSIDTDLILTTPTTSAWGKIPPKEVKLLVPMENRALQELRKRVARGKPVIGGLLLETVQGTSGVSFFRPEFLLRLRKLCDELQIPIFADEIMTGGGRTGKFFAYQNYPGFEPDFVTFGKGLMVAGVARVKRGGSAPAFEYRKEGYRDTTLKHYSEALLKSAQTMDAIRERGLMANAASSGAYFVAKLKEVEVNEYRENLERIQARRDRLIQELPARKIALKAKYDEKVKAAKSVAEKAEAKKSYLAELQAENQEVKRWSDGYDSQVREIEELKQTIGEFEETTHGLGMLIHTPVNLRVEAERDRLLPPLTLTPEEIDALMKGASYDIPYR